MPPLVNTIGFSSSSNWKTGGGGRTSKLLLGSADFLLDWLLGGGCGIGGLEKFNAGIGSVFMKRGIIVIGCFGGATCCGVGALCWCGLVVLAVLLCGVRCWLKRTHCSGRLGVWLWLWFARWLWG